MSAASTRIKAVRRAPGKRVLPPRGWFAVGLGLVIAWPFILDYTISSPTLLDASVTTLALIMMALGLNIVVGFAGLLDLGYVAFFAIGAYVMGWLGSGQIHVNVHFLVSSLTGQQDGIHLNFFLVALAAGVFTAMWGAILGFPTLRLRGDYLAIVTLAFGEIVPRIFLNADNGLFGIGHFNLTNGTLGITPVDKIYVPGLDQFNPLNLKPWYYVALIMALVTLGINIRLRDSRLGRSWVAVREDEVAAASMGVNLVRTKLWSYALGAAFGGAAGAFLGTYQNTVNVSQFQFGFSVFILVMIIIGGMGNIWGVMLGAVVMSMINRFLLPELNGVPDQLGFDFDVTQVTFGVFGFLLLIMMVLRPEGFLPERRRALEIKGEAGVHDESLFEERQA